MDILLFFKGFAAGLIIAIPIGPVGIFCLQQTVARGPLIGLFSGFGAATADIIYGTIAGLGLSIVSTKLDSHYFIIRIIGSIFLFILGLYILISHKKSTASQAKAKNLLQTYMTSLFITLSNPSLILMFAGILATFKVKIEPAPLINVFLLMAGIFLGSSSWWLVLSGISKVFDIKLRKNIISYLSIISGLLIIGFSILNIIDLVRN